jgi:DNA-binding protein H-NS
MSNSAVSYKDLLAQRATLEAQIEAARKAKSAHSRATD